MHTSRLSHNPMIVFLATHFRVPLLYRDRSLVQGGLDADLRAESLRDLTTRDLPGYAIGGLAGGEDKDSFWRIVAQCTAALPRGKPRYVMGIGFPVDIVVCSALGADMYDSVYPTRTARFGVALARTEGGAIKLKKQTYVGAALARYHCCLACSLAHTHCLP